MKKHYSISYHHLLCLSRYRPDRNHKSRETQYDNNHETDNSIGFKTTDQAKPRECDKGKIVTTTKEVMMQYTRADGNDVSLKKKKATCENGLHLRPSVLHGRGIHITRVQSITSSPSPPFVLPKPTKPPLGRRLGMATMWTNHRQRRRFWSH